jgi:(2R)-3-sulfolactate dehydrogenase (NADP+)
MARAAGQSIPLGWAVDRNGNPTTDPEAALAGSLVSAAGYKGWALGLLVEMLAAGLTGSVNSVDVQALKLPDGPPHDLGQFYILIDPGAHADSIGARFERLAGAIENDPGVRIPGSRRKWATAVDVDRKLWTRVIELAAGAK